MHWSRALTPALLSALLTAAEAQSVFTQSSNDSLLWGPYRPGLYFGVRPRQNNHLTTSLLWARAEDYNAIAEDMRFTCEQDSGMDGYGWDIYDPRTGGVQTIRDKGNGIDLQTTFVKFDGGKSWGARIKGTVREDAEPGFGSQSGAQKNLKTNIMFTVGIEGLESSSLVLDVHKGEQMGFEGDVSIVGRTKNAEANEEGEEFSDFYLTVTEPKGNKHPVHGHPSYQSKPLDRTLVHSIIAPEDALWQGKGLVFQSMKQTIEAYNEEFTEERMPPPWQTFTIVNKPGPGNSHVIQKMYEGDFHFDIFYSQDAPNKYTAEDLTAAIDKAKKGFDEKFASVLTPQAPFKDKQNLRFSKSLFSNLIGGLGYFHGDHLVDRSYAPAYDEEDEDFWLETEEARSHHLEKREGPYTLFTSIPSRPFFPRGFLWDEGFHLLPILDFDPELAMQVVSSWFGMMDEDGWIPREIILGNEARSKVPREFQVQYPHYANPPTLYMVLDALLDKLASQKADTPLSSVKVDEYQLKIWLKNLYPVLQQNLAWYRKTQSGDLKNYERPEISNRREGYRWRGRTPKHILTSGLDDYPRAQPPHPGELHIDLISWIGFMTRSLGRIAKYLGEDDDVQTYAKTLQAIKQNIDDLHWDKTNSTYCDVTIDSWEESAHVCHKGYVSIFPFLTGLMGPDHKHLGAVLELIADEKELWSPFGIRSLSVRDELYGTEENYWRSPVWMNVNYLVLENLKRIAEQPGAHQPQASTMYTSLRKNLVNAVYNSWEKTGFAWEQYNPETGEGQRTQHFTGWTSLVVKIMAMPETVEKGKAKSGHDEL